MIDLQQAVAEYQSVFSSNPTQFGQVVSTEGNGFATDTVVNSIPLYATNFTAIMSDLKAADYATAPPDPNPSTAPAPSNTAGPVRVHIYWRWSSAIPTSPFNPINLLAQFDPTFDSNKGKPKLPVGSNQDVDVAILKSGDHSEEHPYNVRNLYQPQASILPLDLATDPAGPKPVFWYIATGHQNSEHTESSSCKVRVDGIPGQVSARIKGDAGARSIAPKSAHRFKRRGNCGGQDKSQLRVKVSVGSAHH